MITNPFSSHAEYYETIESYMWHMCRTKDRSLRVEIIKFSFTDTRSFAITEHAKETSMFKYL